MAQMGFFDLSDHYASFDAKRFPLVEIDSCGPNGHAGWAATLVAALSLPNADCSGQSGEPCIECTTHQGQRQGANRSHGGSFWALGKVPSIARERLFGPVFPLGTGASDH
jgi:hypothetical protein